MIVLGPHVLSHRPPDDGGDDDDGDGDHRKEDDDEEGADEDVDDHDAGALADGCLGDRRRAVDDEADDGGDDGGDDGDAAASLRIWTDARLAASAALGSIGAPPLSTPPPPRDRRRRHSRSRGMPLCIAATDMAHAHSDLLRSMRAVLGTLRAGTSVRLGLGPIGWSGGGVGGGCCLAGRRDDGGLPVARAERAWAERALADGRRRRRRRNEDDDGYDDDGHENSRSDDSGNNGHGDERPTAALTFQKLRDVLHRAIADQASSLRNALGHCRRDDGVATATTTTATTTTTASATTMAEWETFAIDLRLSATTARRPPLTLSRLSDWIDRLGGYLSFVLSAYLGGGDDDDPAHRARAGDDLVDGILVARLAAEESTRFAGEMSAYLRSACPTSRPPREDEIDPAFAAAATADADEGAGDGVGIEGAMIEADDAANPSDGKDNYATATRDGGRRGKRPTGGDDELLRLRSTFEAARISLWAFGRSRPEQRRRRREVDGRRGRWNDGEDDDDGDGDDDEGTEDARVWWAHFKDFVERSVASIPGIESHFLLGDERGERGGGGGAADAPRDDAYVAAECSEHVGDAVDGNGDGEYRLWPRAAGGGSDEAKYAGKTLVFSGSGVGVTTRRYRSARTTGSTSGRPTPSSDPRRAFDATDQTMLLRDLELRIKTMGLSREEHEVVVIGKDFGADVDLRVDDACERGRIDGRDNALPDMSAGQGRHGPFFLGASGSLLDELTSAINGIPPTEGHDTHE